MIYSLLYTIAINNIIIHNTTGEHHEQPEQITDEWTTTIPEGEGDEPGSFITSSDEEQELDFTSDHVSEEMDTYYKPWAGVYTVVLLHHMEGGLDALSTGWSPSLSFLGSLNP